MPTSPTTIFETKTTISDPKVTLRPVTTADVPALAALMDDRDVAILTGSVHSSSEPTAVPTSVEQLTNVYHQWTTATDRIVWAVLDNSTGKIVGEAVLFELCVDNRACSFRIWLGTSRNNGLGTAATRLATHHALTTCGLHRVELEVYAHNPRGLRTYEKCGFVHEGTKRDALLFDDAWIDCHVMSRLATDPVPQ